VQHENAIKEAIAIHECNPKRRSIVAGNKGSGEGVATRIQMIDRVYKNVEPCESYKAQEADT